MKVNTIKDSIMKQLSVYTEGFDTTTKLRMLIWSLIMELETYQTKDTIKMKQYLYED